MNELTETYNEIFEAIQKGDTHSAIETLQAFAAAVLLDSKFAENVMSEDLNG